MRQLMWSLYGFGILAGACGITRLDAGSTGKDGGASDAGTAEGMLWPYPPSNQIGDVCSSPAPSFAAGVWKGQFDSYVPVTGPSIQIDVNGAVQPDTGLCGTVVFGSGDPLPLPADARDLPPDPPSFPLSGLVDPIAGFPYEYSAYGSFDQDAGVPPASTAAMDRRRLRFTVNLMQVYKAWCNMQPSYLEVPGEDVSKVINDPTATFLGGAFGKFGCVPPHAFTTVDTPGGHDCDALGGLSVHGLSCAQAEYCVTGMCSCGGSYVGAPGRLALVCMGAALPAPIRHVSTSPCPTMATPWPEASYFPTASRPCTSRGEVAAPSERIRDGTRAHPASSFQEGDAVSSGKRDPTMRRWGMVLGGVGALAAACGVTRLDAGSTGKDAGASDAGIAEGALWPYPPSNVIGFECTAAAPSFAAGVWKGKFDSYVPVTGPNIEIDVDGTSSFDHGVCGKVIFGSGDPLPLPTSADAPPPDAPAIPFAGSVGPTGGFPYEFHDPGIFNADAGAFHSNADGRRFTIPVNLLQVYKAWCNMQKSYLEVPGENIDQAQTDPTQQLIGAASPKYGCIPPHAFSNATTSDGNDCEGLNGLSIHGISCAQAEYCITGLCSCGALGLASLGNPNQGCTADTYPARFDVTVSDDGSTMTGSFVLPTRVETVHLTR